MVARTSNAMEAPLPRYNAFEIRDFVYKTVHEHPILLSVLIPKTVKRGKRPILVRFHGGGLVEGVRLGDWFRPYILDYCAANSIVIVSPDYRLLPEATGWDILEDVRDFWHWMASELPKALHGSRSDIELDLGRIAVSGESAGGYLAAQSFVVPDMTPAEIVLRAVLMQAPILDLDPLTSPARGPIFDFPLYDVTKPSELRSSSGPGKVVTNHEPDTGARTQAAISMFQHGTFVDALHGRLESSDPKDLNTDDVFWPIRNLEGLHERVGSGAAVPALWIVAGWHDCMVAPEGAVRFCSEYKRLFRSASVHLTIGDGDHGFDGEWSSDDARVERGWVFLMEHW